MKRIVERCPRCGVEHDHRVHECEACGSALRHWCRAHSREIGWLATDECRRCAEEAARPMPRHRPAAPSPAHRARGRRTMAAPPPPAVKPAATTAPPKKPELPTREEPAPPREREPFSLASWVLGAALRVWEAVLALLWAMIVCILIGVAAGAVYAFFKGADVPLTALDWGVYGGFLGTVIGFFSAFGPYIFADVPRRKRR